MLNRNAEALFWIGRYMERAENHARLIDVHYHLQQDELRAGAGDEPVETMCKWARIVDALGSRHAFEQQYDSYEEREVLMYVTLDRDNPNSLVSCVNHARNNLRTLREKVPGELWDAINGFYLWLREKQPDDLTRNSPHQFFGQTKDWTALFQGYCQSVMPRENEWHFIECGRYLERAENTLRIMQAVEHAAEGEGWNNANAYPYLHAVLKSVSGYQSFRRNYLDSVAVEAIIEFVVLNPTFPRSVHFALQQLVEHMRSIDLQDKTLRASHERIVRQVGKVIADIGCLETDDLVFDRDGRITAHLLSACESLGMTFAKTFFRMGEASA